MFTPRFWLLAGPNGSGKSTVADTDVFQRLTQSPESPQQLTMLNADAVGRELSATRPDLTKEQRDLLAAQTVDAQVDQLVEERRSFLVETVLSTDKYRQAVERARARGFWIGLVYVLLDDPELNVARVAQRVAQGGHDVAEDKVRERWVRSLRNLSIFAALADAFTVWDNSSPTKPAVLLIESTPDRLYVAPAASKLISRRRLHPALRDALKRLTGSPSN